VTDNGLDLVVVREVLRDLQRDYREDPFFADLFSTRATGFLAATGAARAESLSAVSVAEMTHSWQGLCERLGVPHDVEVADLDELLELSDVYDG
jgi:hypothetical protein